MAYIINVDQCLINFELLGKVSVGILLYIVWGIFHKIFTAFSQTTGLRNVSLIAFGHESFCFLTKFFSYPSILTISLEIESAVMGLTLPSFARKNKSLIVSTQLLQDGFIGEFIQFSAATPKCT